MREATILAIDQGTTSTRAIEFGAGERRRLVHAASHRQILPRPGWVEHDPEELLANVLDCLPRAGDGVAAVALANQGESCLAWEAGTGRPITPVIVWQDARTQDQVERLREEGCEALSLERAGLPLDPYFSASKLGWICREVDEAGRLLAAGKLRLGTTDAFFLERLAGRFVTDMTTASRTGLMNLATGLWDEELCRLHGVPVEALPEIVSTTGDFGRVSVGTGSAPLAASVVDQQAALYGHGCREPGDGKITFGTGAFALAVTGSAPLHDSRALPTVAWQKAGEAPVYALDGGVYTAAAALNWAQGLGLRLEEGERAAGRSASALSKGLIFVPALAGLACPHWKRNARGAWFGLGLDTSPADLLQAVLEGVAFRVGEVVAEMERIIPLASPLPVDGGMSGNEGFMQFLANVLERELRISDEPELTARGAAELAAEQCGIELALATEGSIVRPRPLPAGVRERFAKAREAVSLF